jgi:hypothetical protein
LVNEIKAVLQSGSFIAALCVAPFVFMSVYIIVNKSPGDPASYLLAFQNGFFCETVFGRMFNGRELRSPERNKGSQGATGL